jgi:hypothetical protein
MPWKTVSTDVYFFVLLMNYGALCITAPTHLHMIVMNLRMS